MVRRILVIIGSLAAVAAYSQPEVTHSSDVVVPIADGAMTEAMKDVSGIPVTDPSCVITGQNDHQETVQDGPWTGLEKTVHVENYKCGDGSGWTRATYKMPDCKIVRRKGKLYVINKKNPRFKQRQG